MGGLLERARARLDAGAAGLITVYADGAALVLAALAIFVEPVGYLAVAAFVFLLVRGRQQGERKYAGPADPEMSESRSPPPADRRGRSCSR